MGHRGRASLVFASAVLMLGVDAAAAQAASIPQAFAESAIMGGSGNRVSISRVPVRNSLGVITYKDVVVLFSVSPTGVLTMGAPFITASPAILSSTFIAGRYKLNGDIFTVTGPGVAPGGRTIWSITGPSTCALNASWTTGPIAGHPQQVRLNNAQISYQGYSYGVTGDEGCFTYYNWSAGRLTSAAGGPTGLTLFSYGYYDSPTPQDTASFTRCTNALCN